MECSIRKIAVAGKGTSITMKRAAIFVFFEKEGIVGKYVEYLLSEIQQNVIDLFIISNGRLRKEEKDKLYGFTDYVYERENEGYDGGAYKEILCDIIRFSNLKNWDELLLVNDTFYGPFCPLLSIFEQMEPLPCDFWGLTLHGERRDEYISIAEHIQSYFMVIRSKMLHSRYFSDFWLDMRNIHSFQEAVSNFEIEFTIFFSKHGFTYDAWLDTTYLENEYCRQAVNIPHYMAEELITKKNFPVLKRKALTEPNPYFSNPLNIIKYIEQYTNYDVGMIWEDILRRFSIEKLIFQMHLLYMMNDWKKKDALQDVKTQSIILLRINDYSIFKNNKVFIIEISRISKICFLLENTDLAKSINEEFGNLCMYVIGEQRSEAKFWRRFSEKFNCVGYINLEHLRCQSYELTRLVTDRIQYNLVKSHSYIYQIISLMFYNKSLGMLLPPQERYGFRGDYVWGEDAFWIKGECLRKLCCVQPGTEWLPEQLRKLGYYSAIIETADYAWKELAELNQNRLKMVFQTPDAYFDEFWFKYSRRYIFGTGIIAEHVTKYLMLKGWNEYEGYIVSRRKEEDQEYYGKKVWQLNEIDGEDLGIILAVSHTHLEEILPLFNERKEIHYFIIRGMERPVY